MTAEREPTRPVVASVPARLTKWTAIGAGSAGFVGGVVGLILGLRTYPPTAWFAIFEIGIPATIVGAIAGLVAGTIAIGVLSHAPGKNDTPDAHPHPKAPRWPQIVVTLGAAIILYALWSLDWATRVDSGGAATFKDGPTSLLAAAALASLALALIIVAIPSQWCRWFLLATALTTATAVVVVALASIASANTSTRQELGSFTTSYGTGAAVAFAAACFVTGCALVGLLHAAPCEPGPPPRVGVGPIVSGGA